MPDIVSKIVIGVEGGDKAATEITKIKKAYEDVSKAAQGVSAATIGAVTDPFSRALVPAGENALVRESRKEIAERGYQNRMMAHQQAGVGGALAGQGISGGVSGITALARGDVAGASAAGLGATAGVARMSGLTRAVPWIAAAAATAAGIGSLLNQEFGRAQQYYGTGLTQQMGVPYTTTRNFMIGLGASGVPLDMAQAFMTAVTQTGAFGGR
ncbi:MAG: hypothetical protein ACXADB_00435, partial [Candidatus Hermodarchaeia archaeon]